MNYLNHSTLKAFLYLLYGKGSLLLFDFKYLERQGVIEDIFINGIESLFVLKNSEGVLENPTKDTISEILYDFSPNIKTIEIGLPASNKEKLSDFINSNVNNYKDGKLLSIDNNYYPFDKSYKVFMKLLKKNKVFGKRINSTIPLNEKSRELYYKKEVRLLDIIFHFLKEKHIDITVGEVEKVLYKVIDDYYEEEALLPITIILNRPLKEISNIEETWSMAGTVSINKITALACYENNEHQFQSTDTKNFKLLLFLVKNHDIHIPIVEAYAHLYPKDKRKGEEAIDSKKEIIISLIKDIREKLNMTKSKSPSAEINIKGKHIILNSNPNKK